MNTSIHFVRFLLGLDKPQTQVTDAESATLGEYCRDARCVVEIGCFEGRTTTILASNSRGTVYSVDPFFPGRVGLCYGQWIAAIHARRSGLTNIQFLRGLSHDIAPRFNQPIDMIFIDGDHSVAAIQRDWADWFPKVRPQGLVALHDCKAACNSRHRLGTMEFYETFLLRCPEVQEIDTMHTLAVFRKVK